MDQVQSKRFWLIVESDERDSSMDTSSSNLVCDHSSTQHSKLTSRWLFCADHCNQWVTKSTFYCHQALCVAERKKESIDEDSSNGILQNISNFK